MTQEKLEFQVEGEFLGFIGELGAKLKYLRLAVGESQLQVKLAKKLRETICTDLVIGDRIQVLVKKKFKGRFSKLNFKAYELNVLNCNGCENTSTTKTSPKTGKILLCKKSGCMQRGGKEVYQALKEALLSLGLENQVKIESTSCQKRCKKAPNMVVMPSQTKYSEISPNVISSLLQKHYL